MWQFVFLDFTLIFMKKKIIFLSFAFALTQGPPCALLRSRHTNAFCAKTSLQYIHGYHISTREKCMEEVAM